MRKYGSDNLFRTNFKFKSDYYSDGVVLWWDEAEFVHQSYSDNGEARISWPSLGCLVTSEGFEVLWCHEVKANKPLEVKLAS